MKIWYKSLIREITIEPNNAISGLESYLLQRGYDICSRSHTEIKFKYNIWRFDSSVNTFNKLDGGEFVVENGDVQNLRLSYYISSTADILAFLVSVGFSVFLDHLFFFFENIR